jgi:membrane associated rhomboid family serine protease
MTNNRPFGGGYYNPYSSMFPSAIKWLLIINAALFLLPRLAFAEMRPFYEMLGLVPGHIWSDFYLWQLVTYMFLHGSMWHILMNMFILWMFGSELERTWGSREFLRFYFVSGIGAGLINVALAALRPATVWIPIIGASGAIYGILVAYAMLFPERYVYVYFLFPVKVKYLVIFMVVVEFLSTYQADGVAHFAHLGGALVGFLYLRYSWRWRLSRWSPSELLRRLRARATARKSEQGARMMSDVDAILDKINRVGYDNLTRKEKKILERASDRLSKPGQK